MAKSVFLALLFLCLAAFPALAGAPPSKESLIAAWETAQRENPHTKTFEKTKENGVYLFETDLLPYKGRLTLLNAFIDDREPYGYADYGAEGAAWHGVIEAELTGTPKDFAQKHPLGHAAWNRGNRLYYDAESAAWKTQDAWRDLASSRVAAPPPACAPSPEGASPLRRTADFLSGLIPGLLAFLLFLLFLVALVKRTNKAALSNQTLMMDRQLAALRAVEEGLAQQREQVKLLKDIAESLKR